MRVNLVGRSVVSAMTHTPASGPLAPVTTPPMSSGSMDTARACCAATHVNEPQTNPAKTNATMGRFRCNLMSVYPSDMDSTTCPSGGAMVSLSAGDYRLEVSRCPPEWRPRPIGERAPDPLERAHV